MIYSRVENHNLRYSLDDEAIFVPVIFQKEILCSSSRFRIFLKNDPEGKVVLTNLEESKQLQKKLKRRFLLAVSSWIKSPDRRSSRPLWTVCGRARRWLYRTIFVDLAHQSFTRWALLCYPGYSCFLKIVEKGDYYQIGKHYYEKCNWLLLMKLVKRWSSLRGLVSYQQDQDASFIFPNAARHLYFPSSLFEEGVNRLMNLPHFRLEYSLYDYDKIFFKICMLK